jgi:hypothetical protein
MSIDAKKWLAKAARSAGIATIIWVLAWLWGGVNFAFGVLAVVTLLGLIGVFFT